MQPDRLDTGSFLKFNKGPGLLTYMRTRLLGVLPIFLIFLFLGCTQQQWHVIGDKGTKYGIYIMDMDGKNVRQIYGSDTNIAGVVASPDGEKIAFFEMSGQTGDFEGVNSAEIAAINIDGTGYQELTNNDYIDLQPQWYSDTRELLFISNPNNVGTDIYVMSLDGNVIGQLTNTPGISEADPNCKCGKIVFTRDSSVWIMNDDGTGERKLTEPLNKGVDVGVQFPIGDYDPDLSPDCGRVVFSRLVGPGKNVGGINIGDYDLYVYDIESGTEKEISNDNGADFVPEWSDYGIIFIYVSDVVESNYDIFMINSDGTDRKKVTGNDPLGFVENGCSWLGNQILFTAEIYG
jgi:Tol biopolymer transport system component